LTQCILKKKITGSQDLNYKVDSRIMKTEKWEKYNKVFQISRIDF